MVKPPKFKEYDADYVIMKDSGIEGVLMKIKACINLGTASWLSAERKKKELRT